ncbi:MAG TPA: lipopolysaccharide heptosyltransferase II [Verrucomicrobiae bacterium]|nr:lipopolysaccharide heptosyltransferase II [Verrucomicrobiae bacterium]
MEGNSAAKAEACAQSRRRRAVKPNLNTKAHAIPHSPGRILVRGVNWLGDAIMTTPALQRLRERFPAAHITLFTAEKLQDIWLHHNAINEVVSFKPGSLARAARQLRAGAYDLGVVLPNSMRSALEVWLAGIPSRAGYARGLRKLLLTIAVPHDPGTMRMRKRTPAEIRRLIAMPGRIIRTAQKGQFRHQIHDYLHLVGALGANTEPLAPEICIGGEELRNTAEKFGLDGSLVPLCALNAGAEYGPAKRWPAERFIAAAKEIAAKTGCRWLILGGPADVPLATSIQSSLRAARIPSDCLAGRTSLRELCAVLKLCDVALTNDTGPMHVAAAVGTRVVVPFGSTSAELTGPGLPGDSQHQFLVSNVPCSPCFLRKCPIDFRCMNSISVSQVAEAVVRAMRS